MRRFISITILLLVAIMSVGARSQPVDTTPRISLVIATPGTEVYELEGHAGLRITDDSGDWVINWGGFDFNAPNFVYRFVKGETDYKCFPTLSANFFQQYAYEGRGVYEIPLNLTSDEARRVIALISENLSPGNEVYRYNYVRDNCSTRPIAIIEKAVGDTIMMRVPQQFIDHNKVSFRDVMRFYHKYYPWYQFGIDLALGDGIDYPISRHDMAFAPILLPELLKGATIAGRPLAKGDMKIIVEPMPWQGKPTPWCLTPLAVSIIVALLSLGFSIKDLVKGTTTRWFDAILFTVIGLLGCVLTFLIFVSTHEATSPNWLIFWLNPFAFIVPIFVWLKNGIRAVYCYHFLNFVALLLLSIAWPFLGQEGNIAFIPLIIADAMRSVIYLKVNRCALRKVEFLPE